MSVEVAVAGIVGTIVGGAIGVASSLLTESRRERAESQRLQLIFENERQRAKKDLRQRLRLSAIDDARRHIDELTSFLYLGDFLARKVKDREEPSSGLLSYRTRQEEEAWPRLIAETSAIHAKIDDGPFSDLLWQLYKVGNEDDLDKRVYEPIAARAYARLNELALAAVETSADP